MTRIRIAPAWETAQGKARAANVSHRGISSAIPHKWGCASSSAVAEFSLARLPYPQL